MPQWVVWSWRDLAMNQLSRPRKARPRSLLEIDIPVQPDQGRGIMPLVPTKPRYMT